MNDGVVGIAQHTRVGEANAHTPSDCDGGFYCAPSPFRSSHFIARGARSDLRAQGHALACRDFLAAPDARPVPDYNDVIVRWFRAGASS
jgi:hypothetical protein